MAILYSNGSIILPKEVSFLLILKNRHSFESKKRDRAFLSIKLLLHILNPLTNYEKNTNH